MLILPTSLYICDGGGDDIGVLVVIVTNVIGLCSVFLFWHNVLTQSY